VIALSGVLTPIAVGLLIVGLWTSSIAAMVGALCMSALAGSALAVSVRQRRVASVGQPLPSADERAVPEPAHDEPFPPMAPVEGAAAGSDQEVVD